MVRAMPWESLRVAAMMVAALDLLLTSCMADDWRWGRSTFYGDKGYFSIHEGSCGFGYLDGKTSTGWNIAAMPDVHYEHSGSCGRCYEVKCEPMTIRDNWGNEIDRSDACYDPNKVIVVTITDTCPCGSNSRWCCGDADHLDLSYVAYDQLADRRWGVIGLKYRPAPCPGEQWDQGYDANESNDWDQTSSSEPAPDQSQSSTGQNNDSYQTNDSEPAPDQLQQSTEQQNEEDQKASTDQPPESNQPTNQTQTAEEETQAGMEDSQASGQEQNTEEEQTDEQGKSVEEEQSSDTPQSAKGEGLADRIQIVQQLVASEQQQVANKVEAPKSENSSELGVVAGQNKTKELPQRVQDGKKTECMGGSLWWLRASLTGENTDASKCQT